MFVRGSSLLVAAALLVELLVAAALLVELLVAAVLLVELLVAAALLVELDLYSFNNSTIQQFNPSTIQPHCATQYRLIETAPPSCGILSARRITTLPPF